MEWLRGQWKSLIVIVVVNAFAIMAFAPDWNDLQTAADAAAFREILESPGRVAAAAGCDVIYAIGYGLLGIVGMRVYGGNGPWAAAGAVSIGVGAICDVIENCFMLANVARHRTLTDGWIDAMQVPGTIKWVAAPGFVALLVLLIVRAVRR